MKVTDHALIRYIERIEEFPLAWYYNKKTGKSRKKANDSELIDFITQNQLLDTTRCKKYIARMFSSDMDNVNRNEFHAGLCFVIRDGWLITIIDKSDD